MSPKVAIIIVNWNGKADTIACLDSLLSDDYSNKLLLVVDNGSRDDSVSAIRGAYSEVTVLETGSNLGFTGGNNVGIQYALTQNADYVYLLNNDTTVEANALTKLVEAAEANPDYGLLTPIIHYFDPPREVWFGGAAMDIDRGIAVHDNKKALSSEEAPVTIPWATGCATLIPAKVIRQLGGYDDRYYLYWEDVDLSLRVVKLGYKIALVPSARIYHKCGRSSSTWATIIDYYSLRNLLLLVSTHGSHPNGFMLAKIVWERVKKCPSIIKHHPVTLPLYLKCIVRAVYDYRTSRFGPCFFKLAEQP